MIETRIPALGGIDTDTAIELVAENDYREMNFLRSNIIEDGKKGYVNSVFGNSLVQLINDTGTPITTIVGPNAKTVGFCRDEQNNRIYYLDADSTGDGFYYFDGDTNTTHLLFKDGATRSILNLDVDADSHMDFLNDTVYFTDKDGVAKLMYQIDGAWPIPTTENDILLDVHSPIDAPTITVGHSASGDESIFTGRAIFCYRIVYKNNMRSITSQFTEPVVRTAQNYFTDLPISEIKIEVDESTLDVSTSLIKGYEIFVLDLSQDNWRLVEYIDRTVSLYTYFKGIGTTVELLSKINASSSFVPAKCNTLKVISSNEVVCAGIEEGSSIDAPTIATTIVYEPIWDLRNYGSSIYYVYLDAQDRVSYVFLDSATLGINTGSIIGFAVKGFNNLGLLDTVPIEQMYDEVVYTFDYSALNDTEKIAAITAKLNDLWAFDSSYSAITWAAATSPSNVAEARKATKINFLYGSLLVRNSNDGANPFTITSTLKSGSRYNVGAKYFKNGKEVCTRISGQVDIPSYGLGSQEIINKISLDWSIATPFPEEADSHCMVLSKNNISQFYQFTVAAAGRDATTDSIDYYVRDIKSLAAITAGMKVRTIVPWTPGTSPNEYETCDTRGSAFYNGIALYPGTETTIDDAYANTSWTMFGFSTTANYAEQIITTVKSVNLTKGTITFEDERVIPFNSTIEVYEEKDSEDEIMYEVSERYSKLFEDDGVTYMHGGDTTDTATGIATGSITGGDVFLYPKEEPSQILDVFSGSGQDIDAAKREAGPLYTVCENMSEYDNYKITETGYFGKPSVATENNGVQDFTKMVVSGKYIEDSLVNNTNWFDSDKNVSLSKKYGTPTKLTQIGDILKVRCPIKNVSFYIGKTGLKEASGSDMVVTTDDTLGSSYTSTSKNGLTKPYAEVDNGMYSFYIDVLSREFIREASNGSFPISNYGVQSNVRTVLEEATKVLTGYNKKYNEIFFYVRTATANYMLGFNIKKNRFDINYEITDEIDMFADVNEFSVVFKNGEIWLNNDESEICNFFGTQYTPSMRCVFNKPNFSYKMFRNFSYIANQKLKSDYGWELRNDKLIIPADSMFKEQRARNIRGVYYTPLLRNAHVYDDSNNTGDNHGLLHTGPELCGSAISFTVKPSQDEDLRISLISMDTK